MTGRETGEVLDDIDAALDDYVEWQGSVDSASWTADGSHEVTTGGEYYAVHAARFTDALSRALAADDAQSASGAHWSGVRAQESPYGPRRRGGGR